MGRALSASGAPRRERWYVYVLTSQAGRTYVGVAVDVGRRLRQHNGEVRGGARSTRAGRPWSIGAVYGPFPDRGEAQSTEHAVKRTRGAARLIFKAKRSRRRWR